MKVAYPAWSTDKYNWDRVAAALKPLSKVCDLEVFYYGALPDSGDWCSFTKIAPPTNLLNIYDSAHYHDCSCPTNLTFCTVGVAEHICSCSVA